MEQCSNTNFCMGNKKLTLTPGKGSHYFLSKDPIFQFNSNLDLSSYIWAMIKLKA